jgi:hypothetical protein
MRNTPTSRLRARTASSKDLAAYPVGGFPKTSEGGQLQFSAGNEKQFANNPGPVGPFELHPPQGSTLTQYANALVDGAKSYNAHAVRYDGLGQQSDRFNSNSFVSSLIVAKGGTNGLDDVRNIARKLDSGPVTLPGQAPALDDHAMAERVRVDAESSRPIATGFSNARIEPARFGNSSLAAATPPPALDDTTDIRLGGASVLHALWDRVVGRPEPLKSRGSFRSPAQPDSNAFVKTSAQLRSPYQPMISKRSPMRHRA